MITDGMLYSLWLVLAVIGLNLLVGVYSALKENQFTVYRFPGFLRTGILHCVVPLLAIVYMLPLDHTEFLLVSVYYIGALAVFLKYILDVINKIKKIL